MNGKCPKTEALRGKMRHGTTDRTGGQLCNMDVAEVPGSMGTTASLTLRMGQAFFSSASLLFMSFGAEFFSYTSFCYQVTVMGLVIPWSLTLAIVDGYSILFKYSLRQPGILIVVVIGDWILSVLALAAACSTASIVDLLIQVNGSICNPNTCARFQMSAAMAFFSWSLSLASSLVNLWSLPSFVYR